MTSLVVALRRGIPLHRVWSRHRSTTGGSEIGCKLLGERPGSLVLHTETVSGSLGLGAQVRFIDREYVPVFEHDAAIHQDRVYISASFGVDEGVERMIERPQKNGIGTKEHEIGFIARGYNPEGIGHAEDACAPTRRKLPRRLRPEPARWLMGKTHLA